MVAGDRLRPDVRAHPAHRAALGQGRLLRLDLLLRRAGRDDGRHAAPEDAARPHVEPRQPGRTGDPGHLLPAVRRAHRHLDGARLGGSASELGRFYDTFFYSHSVYDYYHVVDMFLAGIVGVGFYFWFSGRVWCRFACPLAALMHIYARFTQLPHLRRQEEVHQLQRLHVGVPPGHRHHELRQQGAADGGPRVRALLGVRAVAARRGRCSSGASARTARRSTTGSPPRRCSWPRAPTARSDCA